MPLVKRQYCAHLILILIFTTVKVEEITFFKQVTHKLFFPQETSSASHWHLGLSSCDTILGTAPTSCSPLNKWT